MLCEEDQQLFLAARAAQVNRNIAIRAIEHHGSELNDSSFPLVGGIVRVLLELPTSHDEAYTLARIKGTVQGDPYRGFSTNSAQESSTYILLSLPRQLAVLNSEQFQLNSISNTALNESEFTRWLRLLREDGAAPPSVGDLSGVAERLRPLIAERRTRQNSRAARPAGGARGGASSPGVASSGGALPGRSYPQVAPTQQQQAQQGRPRSGSVSALGNGNNASMHSMPTQAQAGAQPLFSPTSAYIGGSTSTASFPANPPQPVAAAVRSGSSGANPFEALNQQQRQLARQQTAPTRGAGALGDRLGSGASNTFSGSGAGTPADAATSGLGSPLQQGGRPGTVPLQAAAAPPPPGHNSEEAELQRRLRQDIINHLQQSCTLFARDASSYKLSQLRIVERDMIEYLQHVRDEMSGKQENCVVCMDHVPSVILLPCKHKVLCRLCGPTCSSCPVCRSVIKEMFEPQEI